mmetsp:Transcript_12791/g.32396  ORF Transcript_12791/g.32396 Transcript_12791/m.32396 type:complete len:201 (-) Transcript_12791:328-930(-)|eukprot:CAMPEP_0174900020 /NCGR_PEP_ID=MMETSP0167-20121228/29546_1 /TAXON_ID=38298 /ORGANISM="Rhodella maculata, Strain CCMP736" /LENGTH=200 /DNA_ID=CAMNT_0016141223 /DNA_START=364 /DNA_END=966 /DNA_ORIENTATION=+
MSSPTRLQEAAQELVKAACMDVKTGIDTAALNESIMKLKTGSSSLESLEQKHLELNQEVKALKQEMSQEFKKVREEIEKVNANIVSANRRQIMAAAIQNCDLNAFRYKGHDKETGIMSTGLIRQVLFSFQAGRGHVFPDDATMLSAYDLSMNPDKMNESRELVRNAAASQIHELTGVFPTVKEADEKAEDGTTRYAIYCE